MLICKSTFFKRKRDLAHPYFSHGNETLQRCLSYDMRQLATLFVFEDRLFHWGCLSSGLLFCQVQCTGPGLVFRTCQYKLLSQWKTMLLIDRKVRNETSSLQMLWNLTTALLNLIRNTKLSSIESLEQN